MIITPAKFEDLMKKFDEEESREDKHIMADDLMCEVLSDLGYDAGVKIFQDMKKWYS